LWATPNCSQISWSQFGLLTWGKHKISAVYFQWMKSKALYLKIVSPLCKVSNSATFTFVFTWSLFCWKRKLTAVFAWTRCHIDMVWRLWNCLKIQFGGVYTRNHFCPKIKIHHFGSFVTASKTMRSQMKPHLCKCYLRKEHILVFF